MYILGSKNIAPATVSAQQRYFIVENCKTFPLNCIILIKANALHSQKSVLYVCVRCSPCRSDFSMGIFGSLFSVAHQHDKGVKIVNGAYMYSFPIITIYRKLKKKKKISAAMDAGIIKRTHWLVRSCKTYICKEKVQIELSFKIVISIILMARGFLW